MRPIGRRGFTLIELLTVMAITALLLTVIVVPVFQSFNLTRYAQALGNAQDKAHILADRIQREISNSVGVRSTSLTVSTTVNGVAQAVPQHALIIQVPILGSVANSNAGTIEVVLPYVKMDLISPAEGNTYISTSGQPIYTNPTNGFTDPTLNSPKGQPNLPVGPGATIIRYSVGLRDPFHPYNNPYDGLLMGYGGGRDNLFVLYRTEIQPFVYRAGQGSNGDTSLRWRPNIGDPNNPTTVPGYFQSDTVTDTQIVDYDDPRFFLNDNAANIGLGETKAQRVQWWKNQGVIQTEISRFDMIQPVYNKATHVATYSGNAPVIVPLIQFRPGHIANDEAQGQVAVREGEETNNSATFGPDVFKTQYGLWSNQITRVWPQGWSPISGVGFNQYFVGRNDPSNGQAGAPPGYSIYYYDPAISPTDFNSGTEVFDIYTYQLTASQQGLYPFSQALSAANGRSGWMTGSNAQQILSEFVPFNIDSTKGKIYSSFDISEVGNPNDTPPANDPQNLPTAITSPVNYGPYAPADDPQNQQYYGPPPFTSINEGFNWTWNNATNLQPQVDRYLDLRETPQGDGTYSPLDPIHGFPKARIVPGSEIVYAPDQLPGPNYGNTVRYVRTTKDPGPNQYRINYVDQAEPRDPPATGAAAGILSGAIDYSLIGLTPAELAGFNPEVYSASNFVSAVIQARYKKGYIKFDSDPNVPLPTGNVQVAYRFQFNGTQTQVITQNQVTTNPGGVYPADAFAVDYDTRQLINVLLTIRTYPQTTNIPNPQTVTVKATATARNVIR